MWTDHDHAVVDATDESEEEAWPNHYHWYQYPDRRNGLKLHRRSVPEQTHEV
jgi:hypothetical protein